jgi:ABC-type transport system involved in multi-copper enzyme maturation permease subunit
MSRRIWAIALNTFRESVRNKILYTLLFFAMGMIAFAALLATLAIGDFTKIVRNTGLASIHLMGVAIAVFVGVGLVVQEIDRRTIFTVISKPVRRWEFVVAKFMGLAGLLALELAVLTAVYYAVLAITQNDPNLKLLLAIGGIYVECLVVVGVALFFSSFTSSVLAVLFAVGTWTIGHLAGVLHEIATQSESAVIAFAGPLVARLVPNLEFLNFKHAAVHNLSIHTGYAAEAILYGLGWAALFVGGACLIFARRGFDK